MKKIILFATAIVLASTQLLSVEITSQQKATAAAGRLQLEMRKRLIPSIQKNGLIGSMDICTKDAPALIADLEKTFNLTMKRTALRVRNPANNPDGTETVFLEKLAGMLKAGEQLPQEVTLFSETESGKIRTLRFYKPLFMQAVCVGCHGSADKIPSDVAKVLATRYPKDKGAGYKDGELRGIISVTVKEIIPENEVKK